MRKEKMKGREAIIRNKGSGHEIRENCVRVTSFRASVIRTFVLLIFSVILREPTNGVIISIKRIIAPE